MVGQFHLLLWASEIVGLPGFPIELQSGFLRKPCTNYQLDFSPKEIVCETWSFSTVVGWTFQKFNSAFLFQLPLRTGGLFESPEPVRAWPNLHEPGVRESELHVAPILGHASPEGGSHPGRSPAFGEGVAIALQRCSAARGQESERIPSLLRRDLDAKGWPRRVLSLRSTSQNEQRH